MEGRKEDATSKETLEDLEDETALPDELDQLNVPSPDGGFDDSDDLEAADPV